MSERFEKLFTLTDIEDAYGAPVKIEAGGLIKDTATGRVIARMYLKNTGDSKPKSVIVGFYPKDESGRTIPGMRDYKYDASQAEDGDIFGDNIGVFFDNDKTASFACDIKEIEFDDGGYWDEQEAKAMKAAREEEARKAEEEERKGYISPEPASLAVPAEEAPDDDADESYWKGDEDQAPEYWDDGKNEVVKGADPVVVAAPEAESGDAAAETEEIPAEPEEARGDKLEHVERPALVEETDVARAAKERAVIELDGPSEDDGPVIELGGPVPEDDDSDIPTIESIENAAKEEGALEEAPEEPEEPAAEETAEGPAVLGVTPEATEEPEQPAAEETPAEPEEPEAEEIPEEPEEPEQPVFGRLADMYSGFSGELNSEVPETPVEESEEKSAFVYPEDEVSSGYEAPQSEQAETPKEMPVETAAVGEQSAAAEEAAYAPHEDAGPAKPAVELNGAAESAGINAEPVTESAGIKEEPVTEPKAETEQAETKMPAQADETASAGDVSKADAAAGNEDAANQDNEKKAGSEASEGTVYAEGVASVPTIIGDTKEKELTGEDHSGRNLVTIVVFGVIAVIGLLLLFLFS